ncbi:TfoX/Sxy family protein [Kaarinaea lacus]
MGHNNEFVEFVLEMLQLFGFVTAKPMFGGYGLYADGVMFALIADDTLYFKADELSKNDFTALGLAPFCYSKNGSQYKMSYYCAPDDALEDFELMNVWAQKAFDAALRVNKEKKRSA